MLRTTPLRELRSGRRDEYTVLSEPTLSFSDGSESRVLEIVTNAGDIGSLSDELERECRSWAELYHLAKRRSCLVRGLPLEAQQVVLEVGAGCGALTRYLGERCGVVDAVEPVAERARVAVARTRDLENVEVFVGRIGDIPAAPAYDCVVMVGVLEYVAFGEADWQPYVDCLSRLRDTLRPGGHLICGIENRIGVKYLAGAPEDHSLRPFDGVEGYPKGAPARTFTRRELEAIFGRAGLNTFFLHAFPDYKLPRVLMTDALLGDHELRRIAWRIPRFPSPDWQGEGVRVASEGVLWRALAEEGLGECFGNSFVVVARADGDPDMWNPHHLAAFNSADRRALFATESSVVRRTDGSVVVERRRLDGSGRSVAEGSLVQEVAPSMYASGSDLLELLTRADPGGFTSLLREWRSKVEELCRAGGPVEIDPLPSNCVMAENGVEVIDREWRHRDYGTQDVIGRCLLWLAVELARSTEPARWKGDTVKALAIELGGIVGLGSNDDWLDSVAAHEAMLQAQVYDEPPGASRWGEATAGRSQAMSDELGTQLSSLDANKRVGEQLTETRAELSRLQGEVEQSIAWRLRGYLRGAAENVLPVGSRRRATVRRLLRRDTSREGA